MEFKLDENLPEDLAILLGSHGHDARTVADQQLQGAKDVDVAAICRAEGRSLITLDLDFADIRRYPPADYSGIIVLRPVLQTIPSLIRLTTRLIPLLANEPLRKCLWVVDDSRVRIRAPDDEDSPGTPASH